MSELRDEIERWLPSTPDGKCVDAYVDDLAERLERLLRCVYDAGFLEAGGSLIYAHNERGTLAALRDDLREMSHEC